MWNLSGFNPILSFQGSWRYGYIEIWVFCKKNWIRYPERVLNFKVLEMWAMPRYYPN